jgi:16S rRNA C967 or C1407 C5-methylase (RsmB/RsmF family)
VLPNGALGWVTCQQAGSAVAATRVWDKLRDGHWVSDYYLAAPSKTTYTAAIPRC